MRTALLAPCCDPARGRAMTRVLSGTVDTASLPAKMGAVNATSQPRAVIDRDELARLLQVLRDDGYRLLGPTVRDAAIVYDVIEGIDDLPQGWTEAQEAGTYRLVERGDKALFGFSVGPESFKRSFFAPRVTLWRARRSDGTFVPLANGPPPPRLALIGARSCDLHAVAVQDKVFLQGERADPRYASNRAGTFVIAVNCGQAGGTCFCASMGTGPEVKAAFDLALTELLDDLGHRFVVEIGSAAGAKVLERVARVEAPAGDVARADEIVQRTAASMGRRLDVEGIKELLYDNAEHPRWDDVASRCLACTNCTLVCPTCFCSTTEDVTDLDGDVAERVQRWDSCFTLDHSYVHGGPVRSSIKARYRQWLTHKLASWIDQFGVSGCVGCGRCIVWCPVAIDITQEVAALRETTHGEP
jgi:sulfhydrogenase subunit beta (sulfur reductase)